MKQLLTIVLLLGFTLSHAQDSYIESIKKMEDLKKPANQLLTVDQCTQMKLAEAKKRGRALTDAIVIEDKVELEPHGLITPRSYKKLMQERFSKIVLENEGIPNEVSSAAFKIADSKVSFTLNAALLGDSGKSILSFGVASDIASNSSVIYSNGRWNTAFSINARYSRLFKSTLYYACEESARLDPVRNSYLEYAQRYMEMDSAKAKYAKDYLKQLQADMKTMYAAVNPIKYDETVGKNLKAVNDEIDKWTKYIAENPGPKKLTEKLLDSLYGIETKNESWNAIGLTWLSFYGKFSPVKYAVYFERPNTLVPDTAFNGFRAGVDLNFLYDYTDNLYTNSPKGINAIFRPFKVYTRYHALRFEVARTTNISLYDTAQVVGKDGSKVKATKFIGDSLYKPFYEFSLAFKNLFYFFSSKNWGIELTPRYTFRDKTILNNFFDVDAGLLFQLKDRDKEKAKVNFEFLFSWYDLGNNYNYNYPVRPDRFKISFVGGIPLSTIFKGMF